MQIAFYQSDQIISFFWKVLIGRMFAVMYLTVSGWLVNIVEKLVTSELLMMISYYYLADCTMFPHLPAQIWQFQMGLLAIFFFRWAGGWPSASTPNLEDQVIFAQVFLPLALDTPVSNCRAAVLALVRPGCFISPVPSISGEHYPIRHLG